MHIIYQITDPINNVKYIGSKSNYQGEGTYYGSSSDELLNEAKKNRPETLEFKILEIVDCDWESDKLSLYEREEYWQRKYNVVESEIYVNKTYANSHRDSMARSPQARKKMSESAKKRTGEKNPFFRKSHTKETKEKLSKYRKGKPGTPSKYKGKCYEDFYSEDKIKEIKKKQSEWSKNNVNSKESYQKGIETRRENGEWHTEESKKKISMTLGTKIEIDGINYSSYTEAAELLGIDRHTISKRCKSEDFKNYKILPQDERSLVNT